MSDTPIIIDPSKSAAIEEEAPTAEPETSEEEQPEQDEQ